MKESKKTLMVFAVLAITFIIPVKMESKHLDLGFEMGFCPMLNTNLSSKLGHLFTMGFNAGYTITERFEIYLGYNQETEVDIHFTSKSVEDVTFYSIMAGGFYHLTEPSSWIIPKVGGGLLGSRINYFSIGDKTKMGFWLSGRADLPFRQILKMRISMEVRFIYQRYEEDIPSPFDEWVVLPSNLCRFQLLCAIAYIF